VDQEIRRVSLAANTAELARKSSAPTESNDTRGIPPVSGSSFIEPIGAGVELLMALEAEALADALADALAEVLAEALPEALDIVLAETLEVGLAIMLSSVPLSFMPPESIP
jgi:hypothetical protein